MTFNWFHYKELNPDLPINGIATEDDCINHYNIFGKNENRKINIYDEYKDFDWGQYRNNYLDLANIFTTKEQFENHWLQFGRHENRVYLNIYKEYPNFNWEQYRNNYTDLANIFTTKEQFENHWLQFGRYEERYYIKKQINNIEDWRIFCKDNLIYLNNLDICVESTDSRINAVLVEFRILDNLEFVIRNTIIKLKTKCIYTVVCGNLNFDYINNINSRLNNILTIIKLNYCNIDVDQYSSILTTLSFWENLVIKYKTQCN